MAADLPMSPAPHPEPTAAPWVAREFVADAAIRRGRRWMLLAICVYAAVSWFVVVPHGIGYSWRECDTQAIARNFLLDGFDPLRPRVDWRGDGDGAVECEFPFYQLAIASLLALFGDVEWPGRALSLLAMVAAALSLHRLLELRSGAGPALAGALAFVCGGHAVMLGARVMPDATSVALGLAGLVTFVRFLGTGQGRTLWLAVAALTLAALQKPTTLQLGLVMALWTLLLAPRRLREPRLWAGLLAAPIVVAAWLLHAHGLHAETGLTFGVTTVGDTKFPALHHLLTPVIHAQLARTTLLYGLSGFGVVALLALLVQRRVDRADLALLGIVALGLLATLRYSYHHAMGVRGAGVAGAGIGLAVDHPDCGRARSRRLAGRPRTPQVRRVHVDAAAVARGHGPTAVGAGGTRRGARRQAAVRRRLAAAQQLRGSAPALPRPAARLDPAGRRLRGRQARGVAGARRAARRRSAARAHLARDRTLARGARRRRAAAADRRRAPPACACGGAACRCRRASTGWLTAAGARPQRGVGAVPSK